MAAGKSRHRATMIDVAARAGVSHQTVSRYFRKNARLKAATSEKIAQAVRDLDYRPDPVARSMRTRRSGRVVAILPTISDSVPVDLAGASAAAQQAGYLLDVVGLSAGGQSGRERIEGLIDDGRVEGILAFTSLDGRVDTSSNTPPAVVIGEYDENMRTIGAFADGRVTAEIVRSLARDGHRRFLHVAGSNAWASARSRRNVFDATVAELGLDSLGAVGGDWSVQTGYDAGAALEMASGVTAIVAANDYLAFGVIRALQDRGIDVPGDISVSGWDDVPFAPFMRPSLTTVAVDRARLGRRAMEVLIARIEGQSAAAMDRSVPEGRLILRGSTGPAPH